MNLDGIPTKLNKNRLRYILPDSACTPKLMPYETRPSAALKKKEYMKTTDNEIVLCCMYTCEEEKPLYFCYDIQGVLVLSL